LFPPWRAAPCLAAPARRGRELRAKGETTGGFEGRAGAGWQQRGGQREEEIGGEARRGAMVEDGGGEGGRDETGGEGYLGQSKGIRAAECGVISRFAIGGAGPFWEPNLCRVNSCQKD